MKTMKMILLAFVLLATACSQNTTTPTIPPANTTVYSLDSTYYFKINFNGQKLYSYAVKENASGGYLSYPAILGFVSANNGALINLLIQNANVQFNINLNRVGDTVNNPIGAYDFHNYFPGTTYANITDLNTSKNYTMDSASTILNVTGIGVTNVTGVMSGKLNDGTSLIPFTGSFCLKKIF
jgi:hypothetical protein